MNKDKTLIQEQELERFVQEEQLERFLIEKQEDSLLSINFPFREGILWVKFKEKEMVGLEINYKFLKKLGLNKKEALIELKKKKYWKPIKFKRHPEEMFLGNFEFI